MQAETLAVLCECAVCVFGLGREARRELNRVARAFRGIDSIICLEYAVGMIELARSDLENHIRLWIKENRKENSRLEFKAKIDTSTPAAKAEFIRDVIALANSEGERPRAEGYLVIGVRNGQYCDIEGEHYEGAAFGQILDAHIYPPVRTSYEQFGNSTRPRFGLLIVRPRADTLYVVRKRLIGPKGELLLLPGQCWGRRSAGKEELGGEAIHARLKDIVDSRVDEATDALRKRVKKLESEAGPAFEVKRIRFEMEATRDWSVLEGYLDKLGPYACEFGHVEKHEVLNAVMYVTGMTRLGMPLGVAQSVDDLLMEVMPVKGGGLNYPEREGISEEDQELLRRIEYAIFQLTWDACRYLRNREIVEVAAHLYWVVIRYATLNGLERLQTEALQNAYRCQHTCLEERTGNAFPEVHEMLGEQIADALGAFDCYGYQVGIVRPNDLKPEDLVACVAIIKTGEAVDSGSVKRELPLVTALAVAWKDKEIVGLGAIKRERRDYAASIAGKSGVAFPAQTLELGYIAVSPDHRGHHLSHCIVRSLVRHYTGRLFATTDTKFMKNVLIRFGFVSKGNEWKGKRGMLSFWEKD